MTDGRDDKAGTDDAAKTEEPLISDRAADRLGAGGAKFLRWMGDKSFVKKGAAWLNRVGKIFSAPLFEPFSRASGRFSVTVFLLCGFALLALARPAADLVPNVICVLTSSLGWSQCAHGSVLDAALAGLGSFVALVLAYVVGLVAFTINSKVASIECAVVKAKDRPSRVIVTGLSTWNRSVGAPQDTVAKFKALQNEAGAAATMEAFCAPTFAGGNWQQTLRRVLPEEAAGTLEKVYVIPSLQSDKEWGDFEIFVTEIGGPDVLRKFVRMPGVDYEDFEAVSAAVGACVERETKAARKLKPQEICIDITAGFKVFSAAAALFTLNRALAFSYVTTGDSKYPDGSPMPTGSVRLYDAQARFYRDFEKTVATLK